MRKAIKKHLFVFIFLLILVLSFCALAILGLEIIASLLVAGAFSFMIGIGVLVPIWFSIHSQDHRK